MEKSIQRYIQEQVPGRQITLAHIIAAPVSEIYQVSNSPEEGAVGILKLTPNETAFIAADIAVKAANVHIGYLDRFKGSVVISGDVQSVEEALMTVVNVFEYKLGFATVPVTRT